MKKWIASLVFGLFLLALSTGVQLDSDVMCGNTFMGPGSVCDETRNGRVVSSRTYEEMKETHESAQRTFHSWGRWALLGGGLFFTGLGIWGIVKRSRSKKEPYLGPGYTPGQTEPRQDGQPVGQYMQGMTPLPPNQPGVRQGPPQGYAPQQYPPQPQPNYAPQHQNQALPPNYGPPQQQNFPRQQQYPQPQYPQQPFGPGSQ